MGCAHFITQTGLGGRDGDGFGGFAVPATFVALESAQQPRPGKRAAQLESKTDRPPRSGSGDRDAFPPLQAVRERRCGELEVEDAAAARRARRRGGVQQQRAHQ